MKFLGPELINVQFALFSEQISTAYSQQMAKRTRVNDITYIYALPSRTISSACRRADVMTVFFLAWNAAERLVVFLAVFSVYARSS